jgi:hypothetical protein
MVGAIEAVLAALNAAGVRYLVVGGVAVVLHGQSPDDGGSRSRRATLAIRESWPRDKGLTVFGLWSD